MKRIIVALLVLFPLIGFVNIQTETSQTQLVVYVESVDESNPVAFEAAYLFKEDQSELKTTQGTTLFSATGVSDVFSGIFKQTDGESELIVRLVKRTESGEEELARGNGAVVLLSNIEGSRNVAGY